MASKLYGRFQLFPPFLLFWNTNTHNILTTKYNPWDQGTRPANATDEVSLALMAVATHSDGFNGDTMREIPLSFFTASVAAGRPLALEPEGGGLADSTLWDTLGWGERMACASRSPHRPAYD